MSSPHKRIAKLKKQMTDLDYLCSGTLWKRSLVCGQPRCCCKDKPPALHGPYYYWSRRYKGRLVQKVLSTQQAGQIKRAIRNQRRAQKILKDWESETVHILKIRQR